MGVLSKWVYENKFIETQNIERVRLTLRTSSRLEANLRLESAAAGHGFEP